MGGKHEPHPHGRLVADITSSSEINMLRSRASRRIAKWRRNGMPRAGQFRTADSERPRAIATARVPPSFWITALALLICMAIDISQIGTIVNPEMGPIEKTTQTPIPLPPRHWDAMQLAMADEKHKWASYGHRLSIARQALNEDPDGMAKRLGIKRARYLKYERGDRFLDPGLCQQLAAIGVNLNFVFAGVGPAAFTGHP